MKNVKISVFNSGDIDSQYASAESATRSEIELGEGLKAKFSRPLGIKFMGMTVATVSEIAIDMSKNISFIEMNAPFFVKAQVENEIKKLAQKISYEKIGEFLEGAGVRDNAEIEIKINSDGSVDVASNSEISVGSPRRNLREFKVFKNGEIEGGAGSLDSKAWQFFQKLLG
ncbi:MAG: hypothetical protein IKO42_04675 [Opitutales bacterium]|nr:hypothetical protein [Opitutales bacterium]